MKQKWIWLKQTIKEEGHVLLLGIVAYGGVSAFLLLGKPYWQESLGNYRLLAFAITIMILQKIWSKTRRMKGPWLIKLSVAFREGFWAVGEMMPLISRLFTQMRGFLKNTNKKL